MAAEAELDLFQELGGLDGCRRLSNAFYARVAKDPVLRPIFPGGFHCAIPAFASFLAQFLGGPCEYTPQRWWLSLYESHLRFRIGLKGTRRVGRKHAVRFGRRGCPRAGGGDLARVLRGIGYTPGQSGGNGRDGELRPRARLRRNGTPNWPSTRLWRQCGGAMEAVRWRSPKVRFCSARFERDPAAWVSLLAILCAGGMLQDYLREKLVGDPALARATYARGRTLLHAAAAAANLPIVELLLQLGAVPDMVDAAGHAALYCVGNECSVPGGGDVVRALVRAGANVDAQDGVKRCTALHMAARRGNVEVAGALLDSGAAIEARDSLGDTPLRRAVNCGKVEVAALLVACGADCHSRGSKQMTPLLAARTAAMKRALCAGDLGSRVRRTNRGARQPWRYTAAARDECREGRVGRRGGAMKRALGGS